MLRHRTLKTSMLLWDRSVGECFMSPKKRPLPHLILATCASLNGLRYDLRRFCGLRVVACPLEHLGSKAAAGKGLSWVRGPKRPVHSSSMLKPTIAPALWPPLPLTVTPPRPVSAWLL